MLKFVCRTVVAALCLAASIASPAHADWHEVRTENFTVIGNTSVSTLEDMALELEQFRVLLGILYANKVMPPEPVNVPVYVMENQKSFRDIFDNENAGGVYTQRVETPIFVINGGRETSESIVRGQGRDSKRQSRLFLKHEYVHHFFYINGPAYYPKWYTEGIADYYGSFTYEDGVATVGDLISMRGYTLLTEDLIDWERVFSSRTRWVRPDGITQVTSDDVAIYYAQSWLATHYLMSDPDRRSNLNNYLARIYLGTDDYEGTFETSFGMTMDEMGEKIDAYLDDNQLRITSYDLSQFDVSTEVQSRQLDDWEQEMAFLFARRFFAKSEEAKAELKAGLETLATQRPDRVEPLIELAFLALADEDEDTAAALTGQAYAVAPDNGMVLLLKALTLPRQERAEWLAAARQADPTNALAHYEFARHYSHSPTEEVLDAALEAMYRSAEKEALPMLVGKLLIDLEYYEDAEIILKPISVWASDNATRRQARFMLEQIPANE